MSDRLKPALQRAGGTACALLVFYPLFANAADEDANVLGKIGEQVIKIEDVRSSLEALPPQDRASASSDPKLMNQLVRSLLVQNMVLKEALEKKWDEEPSVAPYLARMRQTAITDTYLQSLCAPPAAYPNEEELQSAYEASKAALLVPRSYHLAQIYIADDKGNAAASTAKLDALKKALKSGGAAVDFAALAATYSDERQSAGKGGDLGWLAETQIQPELRSQLTSLKLNAISEPIKLDDGWHVLQVNDIREPFTPSLVQVRPQLIQQLRAERTRANTQDYLVKLMQEHPIAINELALSKILPSATAK